MAERRVSLEAGELGLCNRFLLQLTSTLYSTLPSTYIQCAFALPILLFSDHSEKIQKKTQRKKPTEQQLANDTLGAITRDCIRSGLK